MSTFNLCDPSHLGDYAAFTDESCVAGHRFMLIGGVICASRDAASTHSRILEIQAKPPFPTDSLQWKNLSTASKLPKYYQMIDLFHELNSEHILDFKCIIIDTHTLNHKQHNDGDAENFFQKMIFTFSNACINRLGCPPTFRLFHGHRMSRYRLSEVRGIINNAIETRQRIGLYRPMRQLEYRVVQESGLHQLTDVLLGSVAYHWNPRMRARPQSPKSTLAHYVQAECPATALSVATPWHLQHFDVWKVRLKDPRA